MMSPVFNPPSLLTDDDTVEDVFGADDKGLTDDVPPFDDTGGDDEGGAADEFIDSSHSKSLKSYAHVVPPSLQKPSAE